MGTAFTYQGRLTDNGQPANGPYDFIFSLLMPSVEADRRFAGDAGEYPGFTGPIYGVTGFWFRNFYRRCPLAGNLG